MTWMTPLLASTSTAMTLAPFTVTPSSLGDEFDLFALQGFHRAGSDVGRRHLSTEHVVRQDRHEGVLVLRQEQCVDQAGRQCCEGLVGRSEDGERAFARQRLGEICGGNCSDERVERPASTATSTIVPTSIASDSIASATSRAVASMLGGTSTLSITWMTPLLASTSTAMTLAPLTVTPSSPATSSISSPCRVSTEPVATSDDGTSAPRTWYVSTATSAASFSGSSRCVDQAGRQCSECVVGRSEDGERAFA